MGGPGLDTPHLHKESEIENEKLKTMSFKVNSIVKLDSDPEKNYVITSFFSGNSSKVWLKLANEDGSINQGSGYVSASLSNLAHSSQFADEKSEEDQDSKNHQKTIHKTAVKKAFYSGQRVKFSKHCDYKHIKNKLNSNMIVKDIIHTEAGRYIRISFAGEKHCMIFSENDLVPIYYE